MDYNGKTILVLFGKKGVGKTTVARLISSYLGDARIISFADPLRAGLVAMTGITLTAMKSPATKEDTNSGICGKSPRYLLQTLGTEWGRDLISKEIWMSLTLDRIRGLTQKNIIVDDGRFPEEEGKLFTDRMASLGNRVILVKITRPGMREVSDKHGSEMAIEEYPFEHTLINETQTTSGLKKTVITFLRFGMRLC